MGNHIDLDSYFARIGYTGRRDATLEVLQDVVRKHTHAIPFENLNPLLGLPVLLNPQALHDKLIAGRRGGYCFEQNLLLQDVLRQLGFRVTGLAARVLWNASIGTVLPRTHMLLLIDAEKDRYLVDVGFGGLTLTGVLRLEFDVEQTTPHETFRLVGEREEFTLEARVRQEWRALYRFDLQPQWPVDYEPVNWYLSTHAQSRFVQNLVAARVLSDRRLALFNAEFAVHIFNGETQRRVIGSVDELRSLLEQEFMIAVPENADSTLARIVGRSV